MFGFFICECMSLHVSFEGRSWISLVITVFFLVASFGIMSFDAAEETKAFPVTLFFFFLRDFAPLGFKVCVINLGSGSFFLGGGSPSAEASPASVVCPIFLGFIYMPESVELACFVYQALEGSRLG